jgi:negative regulator of flagellin synthesis FlgM
MANKINGIGNGTTTPVADGQPVRRTQDQGVGDGQATPSQATQSVTITDSARQLAALEQAVQAAPVINQPKVAAISKSVEDGTYTVDSGKVADKLMQMEQSLYVAAPAGQ